MADPWLKFYPQDWRADERLRNCCLATRGLWIEILALMHRSERYGYLLVNDKGPSNRQLAVQVGATVEEVETALAELEAEGVFSRDRSGTIYSRRMIRDEKRAKHARKVGKKGGNPNLRKQTDNSAQDNPEVKQNEPQGLSPRYQKPEARVPLDKSNGAETLDPDRLFWANAKSYLGPKKASLIGQWVRDFGKEATALAITAAQLERAVEPVEFIQARFRKVKAQPAIPI